MKRPLLTFLAVCFAGVATLAGCGGSGTAITPVHGNNALTDSRNTSPSPTPTPIQLVLGGIIGTPTFPEGDTSTGGQGQQVQGINCKKALDQPQFHHHVQLSMFVNGLEIALPLGTGMKNPGHNNFIYHADCFYFLHTHDQTGIIHIEPPVQKTYTLKNYFAIWGEPLSVNGFAGYTGAVAVYINGTLQPGVDPNTIQLTPFEEITLVIGQPPSWIPSYIFPPGYT